MLQLSSYGGHGHICVFAVVKSYVNIEVCFSRHRTVRTLLQPPKTVTKTSGTSAVASRPSRCRRQWSERASVVRRRNDDCRKNRGQLRARNCDSSRRNLAKNPARYCRLVHWRDWMSSRCFQSWKVAEFSKTIFQAWRVMENNVGHGNVIENNYTVIQSL